MARPTPKVRPVSSPKCREVSMTSRAGKSFAGRFSFFEFAFDFFSAFLALFLILSAIGDDLLTQDRLQSLVFLGDARKRIRHLIRERDRD
jgi:hypothetical protein